MKTLTIAPLLALAALPALAADRWESGSIPQWSDDDSVVRTRNSLRHGDTQVGHDLEGTPAAPDRDYYFLQTALYHSYEVIVRSGTLFWSRGTPFCVPPGGTSVCPRLDHFQADGTPAGIAVPDSPPNDADRAGALRIQFMGLGGPSYVRVTGDTGGSPHTAQDQYDISFRDTTYSVPRFNNTATQSTVVVVQNATDRVVNLWIQFFEFAGTPVHTVGTDLAPRATLVLPSAAYAPLQGRSGSILIAHDGPYGALSGKAVAVEPATGFTFDTPLTPIPY